MELIITLIQSFILYILQKYKLDIARELEMNKSTEQNGENSKKFNESPGEFINTR